MTRNLGEPADRSPIAFLDGLLESLLGLPILIGIADSSSSDTLSLAVETLVSCTVCKAILFLVFAALAALPCLNQGPCVVANVRAVRRAVSFRALDRPYALDCCDRIRVQSSILYFERVHFDILRYDVVGVADGPFFLFGVLAVVVVLVVGARTLLT